MKEQDRGGGAIVVDKQIAVSQDAQFMQTAGEATVKDMSAKESGSTSITGKQGTIYDNRRQETTYWGVWSKIAGQVHVPDIELANIIFSRLANRADALRHAG